ncbi:unnamed protein product [Mesocestoides corti]|uniref:G-protein coupled receptors family 1 profile domain-containing protein n=2 Tax=Mesocestoides corti TaxID=53468 RepID=A0A3P6GYS0_MESCO|nr:unnamed protein product [Mesocestoides corti]
MTDKMALLVLILLSVTSPLGFGISTTEVVERQVTVGLETEFVSTTAPGDLFQTSSAELPVVYSVSPTTEETTDGPTSTSEHNTVSTVITTDISETQVKESDSYSTPVDENTSETTSISLQMRTAPPQHPCVIDVDESEPEFQRYVCTGNWVISLIATTFLLTMIFFAVLKNTLTWGFVNLVDVRKAGVSFPQRPELIVLLCSTIPTIFTTIARPLFYPYPLRYAQFISEVGCMQARQFFDLFARTAAVYHMVFWAYRMPIIRWLWRNYLRFNAFRAVWTKEHIIEVLRDKFAPEKDDKFRRMFQNSPESMFYYAQFLQSGLPMQYLQSLMKPGNRSPSMSTAAIDGLMGPNQALVGGGHLRPGGGDGSDVLPRVNLGHLLNIGSDENTSPKITHYGSFLGAGGTSPSKLSSGAFYLPQGGSHQVSRNTSFRGSAQNRPVPLLLNTEAGFSQHLSPDDAANSAMFDRQSSSSPDMHSLTLPPAFSSQELLFPGHGQPLGLDFLAPNEKKAKDDESIIKPPSREFVYICKHAIPGVIYLLSIFATLPSIFGFDMYQYESKITTAYFYFDFIFIVLFPMILITAAFYHGVLAKTQLNGGPKMRFRLRCYYVNFVVLNMPMLFLMTTAMAYRITLSRVVETEMYGTGIVIALTAYHAQFVLKTTVYTTGCNCICCPERCLNRNPRLRNCIITMVTPRNKAALPANKDDGETEDEFDAEEDEQKKTVPRDPFGQGTEIQITPPETAV